MIRRSPLAPITATIILVLLYSVMPSIVQDAIGAVCLTGLVAIMRARLGLTWPRIAWELAKFAGVLFGVLLIIKLAVSA